MKLNITQDIAVINLLIVGICLLLLSKIVIVESPPIDAALLLSFLVLSLVTLGYGAFGDVSKAMYLFTAIICFEPLTAYLIPDLGASFVAYYTVIAGGVLFVRARSHSFISIVVFLVSFISFVHVTMHVLYQAEGIGVLFDERYRTDLVRGSRYLGGAFLLAFVAGWRPSRDEFYKTVWMSALVLLFGVVSSLVYFVQIGGSLDLKTLSQSRLFSVGGQGANTYAINSLLALFCVVALALKRGQSIQWLIGVGLCLLALIFSKSRAQILALIVFLPFIYGVIKGSLGVGLRDSILLYSIIGLIVILVGFYGVTEFLEFEGRDISKLSGRLEAWKVGAQIIFENPLLGVSRIDYESYFSFTKFRDVHNPFLAIFVYQGAVVGVLFLVAHASVGLTIMKRWKACLHRSDKIILLTAAMVVVSHQSSDIWYSLYFLFLSWAFLRFKVKNRVEISSRATKYKVA